MGDVRFRHAYAEVARAHDRMETVRNMPTEDIVMALAATSIPRDPLVVNILATELQNRVRRTTAAIESIAEGVIIVEIGGAITYVNPTALRLLGREAHELAGLRAAEVPLFDARGEPIPWRDRPVQRAMERGETAQMRGALLQRSNGERFSVSILAAPIMEADHVLGAVVAFRDITDEVQAERQQRFHVQILDALIDAVVGTDLAGRIVYWNAGAERLYGWRASEVLGRDIVDVTPTEASREEAGSIMGALREGRTWSGVFPVRGRSGPAFLAHVTNAPLHDERGQLAGIVGISRRVEPTPPERP